MKKTLDELYRSFIEERNKRITADTVDFIGFNFNLSSNKYELKEYAFPISCLENTPQTNNFIINYANSRNMVRFFWTARGFNSDNSQRYYICLMNRNNNNVLDLLNQLGSEYPVIKNNFTEIIKLSNMKICEDTLFQYSSFYLLAFKDSERFSSNTVGIEWLTRKCPDSDDIGFNYSYDDAYFSNYLEEIQINDFLKINDKLKPFVGVDLHYWFFAIDYSGTKKKYKIYLKGDRFSKLLPGIDVMKVLFPETKQRIIQEMDCFIQAHKDLVFYGIALCVDTEENWSINYYFKPI